MNQRLYIPVIGKLIIMITLMIKGRNKITDSRYDKREIWMRDKTPYQRFRVNAKIIWRRFDTQTRGMGLTLVVLMFIMILINVFTAIAHWIASYVDNTNYKDALSTACLDSQFYAWNFKSCEHVKVKPIPQTPSLESEPV